VEADELISAEGIGRRLAELGDVGVQARGVNRLAWTPEDAACTAWFARQAAECGMTADRDPAGNLWAYPSVDPPWWGLGSHLDSVRDGGRFDGPLGVACGFEIARSSRQPVAVISFADEEGARFNTPTFGSKALAGRLDLPDLLGRTDGQGTALADAMRAAGADPSGLGNAPAWLAKLAGFIEVHIDQSMELARAGQPIGLVSSLASRARLELELRGQADHAGTTPRADRRDALAAAARLIVAAEELSQSDQLLTVTTSRILAEPNAPTTIAARVRLWIDARAPRIADVDGFSGMLSVFAERLAARSGVEISIAVASRSEGRQFSTDLRAELARCGEAVVGRSLPEVVCFAGHDAGVLAERIPAAMLLVRNPTGISHSPQETIDLQDAEIAAQVVAKTLDAMDVAGA
jgi:N-carbamoyl-L-amino-acid hydrolase